MATTTAENLTTVAPLPRRRAWGRRILLGIGAVLLILVLGVAAFAAYMVQHPLPTINGVASLPGLSAPVTVVRDKSGIPHITAANQTDLFRAQGYVVAQDRLWQ